MDANDTSYTIAQRRTFDGKFIYLWSDGMVTFALGQHIRGVGVARSAIQIKRDVEAGWLVMGDAELYEADEIARLVKSARRAVRQNFDAPIVAMRRFFTGDKFMRGVGCWMIELTTE